MCGYWWPISLFPWEWSYNWVDRLLTNECNTRKCLRIILGFTHLIVPFLMTSSSRKYFSDTFVPFTRWKEAQPFRCRFILRCYVDGIVLGLEFMALMIRMWPPLWSGGQSFWLQIERSRVRSPALPDFLSSSGSGTGSTQPREPREVNWGATWMEKVAAPGLENRY